MLAVPTLSLDVMFCSFFQYCTTHQKLSTIYVAIAVVVVVVVVVFVVVVAAAADDAAAAVVVVAVVVVVVLVVVVALVVVMVDVFTLNSPFYPTRSD